MVIVLYTEIFSPAVSHTAGGFLRADLRYVLQLNIRLDIEELCKLVGRVDVKI